MKYLEHYLAQSKLLINIKMRMLITTIFSPTITGVLTSNPQSDLKSDIWISCSYLSFFWIRQSTFVYILRNRCCWILSQWPLWIYSLSALCSKADLPQWASLSSSFWLDSTNGRYRQDRTEEGKWVLGVCSYSSLSAKSPLPKVTAPARLPSLTAPATFSRVW